MRPCESTWLELTGVTGVTEVVEVTEKAIRQIVAAGRVAGTLAFTPTVEHWLDVGARFLHPPWMPWLEQGAREFLERAGTAS